MPVRRRLGELTCATSSGLTRRIFHLLTGERPLCALLLCQVCERTNDGLKSFQLAPHLTIETEATYELREQAENYGPNFNGQIEVLSSEILYVGTKILITAT